LTQDNLERIPRVGHLRITKTGDAVEVYTEALPLNVRPAGEVFNLERHQRLKDERKDIEHFITTLVNSIDNDSEDDIKSTIESLQEFGHEVRDKALQYLSGYTR